MIYKLKFLLNVFPPFLDPKANQNKCQNVAQHRVHIKSSVDVRRKYQKKISLLRKK